MEGRPNVGWSGHADSAASAGDLGEGDRGSHRSARPGERVRGGDAAPVRQLARNQRPPAGSAYAGFAVGAVHEEPLWRVQVWRGDHIAESRIAVRPFAESYAEVMRLRFPGHRVTLEPLAEINLAYSPDKPYDPRD
jgi:hypothetical protein